jgi:hypothetical protein
MQDRFSVRRKQSVSARDQCAYDCSGDIRYEGFKKQSRRPTYRNDVVNAIHRRIHAARICKFASAIYDADRWRTLIPLRSPSFIAPHSIRVQASASRPNHQLQAGEPADLAGAGAATVAARMDTPAAAYTLVRGLPARGASDGISAQGDAALPRLSLAPGQAIAARPKRRSSQ